MPELTPAELWEAWNALQQYVDNHDEDLGSPPPTAARTALAKLDDWVATNTLPQNASRETEPLVRMNHVSQ